MTRRILAYTFGGIFVVVVLLWLLEFAGAPVSAWSAQSTSSWSTKTDLQASDAVLTISLTARPGIAKRARTRSAKSYEEFGPITVTVSGHLSGRIGELLADRFPVARVRGRISVQVTLVDSTGSDTLPLWKWGTHTYEVAIELDVKRKPRAVESMGSLRIDAPRIRGTIRMQGDHTMTMRGIAPRKIARDARAQPVADQIAETIIKQLVSH